MGDERFGIDLAFCDETQRFFTIAAVHAAGLKGEVFAVHFRQRHAEGYELFEKKRDGVIKVAVEC